MFLEPPPDPKIPAIWSLNDFACASHEVIIELQRNVRVRVIGNPDNMGRPIKLFERRKSVGHPILSVEVLITIKGNEVVLEFFRKKMCPGVPWQLASPEALKYIK